MTQYFTRDLRLKRLSTIYTPQYYGAKGDGVTDDTVAIQGAVTAASNDGGSVYFDAGTYITSSTVTATTAWAYFGTGANSIIKTSKDIPLFTFDINTNSVNGWTISGLKLVGPASTNTSSCALRFIGDNTAFVQYGYCNVISLNFNAFLKDEKNGRTTGFGIESMLDWNTWDVRVINPKTYGFWYTQGSGTGSNYRGAIHPVDSSSAALFFDGVSSVVGDVIFNGIQFGCSNAGGIGIKIGDSTNYRAQWDFSGVQFDANCDIPVLMSGVGGTTYKNWNMTNVNWGGVTQLGNNLQPLYGSMIDDRDVSEWKSGVTKALTSTGALSTSCFIVDFGSFGAGVFNVYANGLVGGVNSCGSYYQFQIRENSGALTTSTNFAFQGVANGFTATVSTVSTTATMIINSTPSAAGTRFNATVVAHGDGFKITRT